jgi:hypothetical protein
MLKLVAILAATASLASVGCISSSGSSATAKDAGPSTQEDAAPFFDSGEDAGDATTIPPGDASPPPVLDGGVDAAAFFSSGLGSGIVAHSTHFTLITKTGTAPGGAGVGSSTSYKLISGATPAGTTK